MMIPCNYEVNVATPSEPTAKYGRHYCRIELGNCPEKEAKEKFIFIRQLFPTNWNLRLCEVRCSGREVEV